MESRTLRVGEVDLELVEAGEGRPLLYLHGFLEPVGRAEHLELLARDYRVLAPAHPGFAGSSRPEWMESVEDLAYLYLDLIERLDLPEVHVVGHSLGGWIAAELAVRCSHGDQPARARRRGGSSHPFHAGRSRGRVHRGLAGARPPDRAGVGVA